MNVLYTCDNNYVWIMSISMISLFENNKANSDLCVYLLGEGITKENKEILYTIATSYQREIVVVDVPKLDVPEVLVSKRWPLSAFTRLFAGELLPDNLEKILYLDCDTIVSGNIENLESIDLKNKIFAGVKDCIGSTYKKNIGLEKDSVYVNAGVLLINLVELRKINIVALLEEYLNKYITLINYADQDILNGVFYKHILVLQPQYNVMTITTVHSYKEIQILRKPTNYYSEFEFEMALKKPLIIHYTTNMRVVRPWYQNTNHPLAEEFQKYLSLSPWRNTKFNTFVFRTKESQIIYLIRLLPTPISNRVLGMIHAEVKPWLIRIKGLIKGKRKES